MILEESWPVLARRAGVDYERNDQVALEEVARYVIDSRSDVLDVLGLPRLDDLIAFLAEKRNPSSDF